MKKNVNICFILAICVFLVARLNVMAQDQKMFLSEMEIYQLLKLLESNEYGKDNWHINYLEQLNDSTCLLEVFRNDHTPGKDVGLCKIFMFEKDKIFIYGANCKTPISVEFKIGSRHSPFFVPDSQYWHILVRKKKNNTNFYEIQDLVPEGTGSLKGLKKWNLH